jgi:hypothetical protein
MVEMQKDCRNNPCQRFGSKLNLNVHLHVLALDGAYSFERDKARFHRAGAPRPGELEAVLTTVITRVTHTLLRAGVLVCWCAGGRSRASLSGLGDGLALRATGRRSNTICHRRRPSSQSRHDALARPAAGGWAEWREAPVVPVTVCPSNRTVPPVVGSRATSVRASVDLPQPDSPTNPNVSARPTVRLTRSTAFTTARGAPLNQLPPNS